MGGPWCRVRSRGLWRPPLLPLPLIAWCLLIALTGVAGVNPPLLCEENPCENDGVCYEMDPAIDNAIFTAHSIPEAIGGLKLGAKATNVETTHPNALVSSAIYPTVATIASEAYTEMAITADTTGTSQETLRTVPASTSPTLPADASTSTTSSTATTPSTITPPSGRPPGPSLPPQLEYTVGVLQPWKEAPLTLCPPPFFLIQGFCLHLTESRQGAEESRRLCRGLGGRLADVGPADARLLTRLTWPPPPPPRHGLYAWVDGEVGQQGRRRRTRRTRRTLVGRRLCTAATADTGRLVLRHCEEPHRSLCQRRPLRTAPLSRPRRGATNVARRDELAAEETCHCKEGYGGEQCVTALENEGHEFAYCRDTPIGSPGRQLIVDFGAMGRLPWQTTNPPQNCPGEDVPLPADSSGCIVPSGEAILRYWCQGKRECTPSVDYLTTFSPDACNFGSGYNVSMWLYLRYRDDIKPSSVSQCRQAGTYDQKTRTCHVVTSKPGYFPDQRSRCRGMGGDILYSLDDPEYSGYVTFLKKLMVDTGHDGDSLIWTAGNASEPRPVADLTAQQSSPYPCLSLQTGQTQRCAGGQRLFAVCALPPWPGEAAPDCAPVNFTDYGLTFPETAAGLTVKQDCGAGYTGSATYSCGLDGQWSSQYPDLSSCRSETINTAEAKVRLDQGSEPVSDIVSELATNVTRRTSQGQPLTSGDVISSVQLLPQMVTTQQAQLSGEEAQQQVATRYLGSVTRLVSGLTEGEISWHGMPETQRFDTSTLLQKNVEQSAYLLSAYLDDGFHDSNSNTIRLRTGRYSSLAGNLEYTTQQGSTVTLPDEVGRFNQSGKTSIVFVEYTNMDCLLSGEKCSTPDELHEQTDLRSASFVNSPVVSASAGNTSVKFTESNVTLTFRTRLSAGAFNLTNYQCAYWNEGAKKWSTDGCNLGAVTNESVECLCNHLTSFATLMDINGVIEEGSVLDLALSWLTNIGCVVSLLSLAACLIVFTAIPTLRSERTSVHRNLCFCLFTAEFILLVGKTIPFSYEGKLLYTTTLLSALSYFWMFSAFIPYYIQNMLANLQIWLGLQPYGNATGCAVVAGLLHFFFLASFAWMCIEGVQIYLMVYKVFATRKSYLRYFYLCGYGIPALIVITSLSITKGEGYGTETACWLSTENGLIWAFAGPLLLVVLVNIMALVMALRVTARATKGRSTKAPPQASTWIRGSASLVAILGTTWLFGFLYFSNGLLFFSVVFTILNSLQGFFIFLFHVWLNDKNRTEAQRFMWKTTNRMGLTEHDLTTTSAGVTSRGHGGHTLDTSVGAPAASAQPSTPAATSNGRPARQQKTGAASNLLMRALQRVNGAHYSMKRIDAESKDSTSASHEALRRMESSQSTNVDA